MTCGHLQHQNHTHITKRKPSCWISSTMLCRTAFTILIGMVLSPAWVYSTGPAQQNVSETTRTSLSIEQRHSQEIQELQDRLTFLEEQQSSILDDIAQRIILGGYGALEFDSFQGSKTSFEGKLELLISGQIHDRIRFYNEIDLGVPTGEASAEQAYVDFLLAKWINLRGGVMLVPFGKFNLDHFDPRRRPYRPPNCRSTNCACHMVRPWSQPLWSRSADLQPDHDLRSRRHQWINGFLFSHKRWPKRCPIKTVTR